MRTGIMAGIAVLVLAFAPVAFAGEQKTVDMDGAIRQGGKFSAKLILERETESDGSTHFDPHKLTGVKATGIPWECGISGETGTFDRDFGSFKLNYADGFDFGKTIDLGDDASVSIKGYAEQSGKVVKGRANYSFLQPIPGESGSEGCSTRGAGPGAGKFKAS